MRKEIKILGLSYSQSQSGSYIVVLSEIRGSKKIPIIIKSSDAQQIALKMEDVKSLRPMTHDLFKSLTDAYNIDIQEVFIYSMLEGIFYTKIITTNGIDVTEIECTIGDGIVLSMFYKCPIYIEREILNEYGILINDDGTYLEGSVDDIDDIDDSSGFPNVIISVEDLQHMMEDALSNEEYEIAAEIRDRINKINSEAK